MILNNSKEQRLNLMKNEKEWKALTILAVPSICSMVIVSLYNIVDAWFIGRLGDIQAQAAVAVIFPLVSIFLALGQMIGIGGASYFSRCLGSKNMRHAEAILANAIWAVIIVSIIIMIGVFAFLDPILLLLGATPDSLAQTKSYGSPLIITCFFTIFSVTANNFIRAEGNSFVSMFGIMIGAVLNCVLDPLFMFADITVFHQLGWHNSVAGAAWATVFSQFISCIYLLYYLLGKQTIVKINLRKYLIEKKMLIEVGGIALATFSRQALISLSVICFNMTAKSCSPTPDAMIVAISIVIRVTSLPFYIIVGFLQAYQPFAAYNYGAKQMDRLRKSTKFAHIFCYVFSGVVNIILFIFAEEVVRQFITDTSELGARSFVLTTWLLRAMCMLMPFLPSYLIYTTLFQALGHVVESFILATARNGLFFLTLIIFLPPLFAKTTLGFGTIVGGDFGIMLVQPIADILSIILAYIFSHHGKKIYHTKATIDFE